MAKKILLLTYKDRGQANVFLATAQALLEQDPTVEIHFATFPGLEKDISLVSDAARHRHPSARAVVPHTVQGPSFLQGLEKRFEQDGTRIECGIPASFSKPLGFWATLQAIKDSVKLFLPYDAEDVSVVIFSVLDIIRQVAPDLVVVDGLMAPALTAVYHDRIPFTCLSPNSIKDVSGGYQPHKVARFPAILKNIFFTYFAIYRFVADHRRKEVEQRVLREHQIKLRTAVDLLADRPHELKILVSASPETDFPHLVIPPYVVPCGPIVLKSNPIASESSELRTWLKQRPTIYVNLGTQYQWDQERMREFAQALRILFENTKQEMQCLWKLRAYQQCPPSEKSDQEAHDILGVYLKEDRVRMVDWLDASPLSLLETGHIVCTVHHGGANSYNEAVLSGVPQVVLPLWTDCYDYAQRVMFLGLGRLGSPTKSPQWFAKELAAEMLRVIQGDEAQSIKENCMRLAETCRNHGDGAANAAKAILEQIPVDEGDSSHHVKC
ncbi:hypothetical protein EsDP_00004504 [Epichloe bromicola]|uniref:Erythromycin biosynthesis protein CIII-like C-terminal domain-containing protein n=1 Tax=Epichloe bromicola TaxID=79588 RepID=A0ABQ0CSC1_9HYPO